LLPKNFNTSHHPIFRKKNIANAKIEAVSEAGCPMGLMPLAIAILLFLYATLEQLN